MAINLEIYNTNAQKMTKKYHFEYFSLLFEGDNIFFMSTFSGE
ncbi:hypothetical protein M128_3366 [Bacteroides fragilis str. S6L8]|nr:hypothetical protein M126_3507 [Bacteroides fragilis str. S6L3]EYA08356.1 hypothetical protein M130_3304 [Bacteroides fragilis str. S6R6]EYA99311.1 hypothetical protein M128_3366 [Bacteroides fragilis str. S6L8]EYB03937.1 hypothetical protein M129_3351 [Bacteroides fragilis str. S6R5]EYE45573.1 hypothetical protein M127_3252 [Bacteroides fragilis str. S6L5]EYE51359.1 hypothetical protein M131_3244 [Bacteroides fragilis str. S6R8]DAV11876.1 MAG TPA: hypothetical protein [Caudoviricetes sp.]